jgi:hypothetical protein
MGVNNELTIKFSNKTDSGLTLTGVYDIDADASAADESWMSIAGGFGTLTLGKESSVNDAFGIGEHDLIAEDLSVVQASATISANAGESGAQKTNKLIYVTPAMGGFKAGYSLTDTGASGTTDQIAMGASYTMPLAGGSLMVRYNKHSKDGAAGADTESSNYGAKLTMGAASVIVAHGESTIGAGASQTDDREANGISLSYNLGGGVKIGASTMEAEDDKDKTAAGVAEKYTANAAEVSYSVAPGLSAKVTYVDYDYKAGGEGSASDDSGSITQVTISASF